MVTRMWSGWIVAALIAVLLATPGTAQPAAAAQSEADAAAEFAYGLSGLERDGQYDRLYTFMHPDARAIIPRSAVVGWYREDYGPQHPQAISQILGVRQVSWTWPVNRRTYSSTYEVDYVQPFVTGANLEYVTDTVRLVPTGISFGWFFGRSKAFVDEQIARFPGTVEAAGSTANRSSGQPRASTSQSVQPGCTLVELHPGYPGYRGNVTGVMPHWNGLGDWECLDVLERASSAFDRDREDRGNQQAASALGIHGPAELWTWESWMQIEAQRGMTPHCYTCLMLDASAAPIRTDVQPQANDPRLMTGFLGTSRGIETILASIGQSSPGVVRMFVDIFGEDYSLRALAYYSGGPTQNAQELLAEMQRWLVDGLQKSDGTSRNPATPMLHFAIWEAGGYTRVPESAAPGDQIALMLYAFTGVGYQLDTYQWADLQATIDRWIGSGSTSSPAEYMRQEPIWQTYR